MDETILKAAVGKFAADQNKPIPQQELEARLQQNQAVQDEQPQAPIAPIEPAQPEPQPEKPTENVTENNTINYDEVLQKITDGKIKDVNYLKEVLEKAEAPKEEISELAKNIDSFLKKGGDIKQWAFQQTIDVDSYSQVDLVRAKLQAENPSWSKEKIDDYLDAKYYINETVEEGETLPREVRAARIELEKEAENAKKFFESQKIDLTNFTSDIPEVKALQNEVNTYKEQINKQQLAQKQLSELISANLNGFEDYSFNYAYKDANTTEVSAEAKVKFTPTQIKEAVDMISNPQKLVDKLSQGGKDAQSLVAKIITLTDEKLLGELLSDAGARRELSLIKSFKGAGNVSIPPSHSQPISKELAEKVKAFTTSRPIIR